MTKKSAAGPKKPTVMVVPEVVDRTFLPDLSRERLSFADKPLTLSREALLLNPRAFDVARAAANPFRRGLTILGVIWLVVVVSRALQALLGFLTLPRLDIIATQILDRVTALDWYAAQVAANPAFAQQFNAAYDAVWQLIRVIGGFPSATGIITSLLAVTASLFGGWLLYGAIAHLLARWFGGTASYKQFLAPLALSYAPQLLVVLAFIPGFAVAGTLIFMYMLLTKYIAIRQTYALSPWYSLAVLILPYIVGLVVLAIVIALAIGIGLDQLPYLSPILGFFTN